MKVESRKFEASPHIIYSLIKAQAGSLAKGLLEATMNSADAGATRVDITMTDKELVIADDGKGFVSKNEILEVFEVFGWEHAEGQRTYGRFGIGRAQLWNFCSTKWLTNSFVMDVDIKTKGLNYDLVEDAPIVPGLRIEGKFYEPLSYGDMSEASQELADLVKFCPIEVTLNGRVLTKKPSEVKWTHDLPEAYVLLNDKQELAVYNLGVLVRKYPARVVGSGGIVVSKPGHPFALNMARNDVLQSECKLWRKIKPLLQSLSDERIEKKATRLTSSDYMRMAQRVAKAPTTTWEIRQLKAFPLVNGRVGTLNDVLSYCFNGNATLCIAPKMHKGMLSLHQTGEAFVFSEEVLNYFDVENIEELKTLLAPHLAQGRAPESNNWLGDYKGLLNSQNEYRTLPPNEIKPAANMVSIGLDMANRYIACLMQSKQRRLIVGESERAIMWTDGKSVVYVDQGALIKGGQSFAGFLNLVNILVHEYVHDSADTGSHDHDLEFYERFHDILTQHSTMTHIMMAANAGFKTYLNRVMAKDGKVTKKAADSFLFTENEISLDDQHFVSPAQAKEEKAMAKKLLKAAA